jgi:hypothetical protein
MNIHEYTQQAHQRCFNVELWLDFIVEIRLDLYSDLKVETTLKFQR